MFLLYQSVFLPRLIFNCETWSNLTNQEVESLQKVQLKYLRNMMEVANSTPVAGTFLELGILLINFEIDLRKLKFLWKILQKENDDPVKQVYLELKRNCFEKNWTNEIMEVMHRYGLSTCDEEVECTGKTEWYNKVKRAVYDHALNELNAACGANGKSNILPTYCHWKCQNYVTKLHPTLARMVFRARLGMYDIKCNFKNKYRSMNNLLCPVCSESEENLSHVAACSSNPIIKVCRILKSYHEIYGSDISILNKWARFLRKYDDLRNYMLK